MSKNQIYIGLGSNLGDRLSNLKKALQKIDCLPATKVKKFSSIYETEPIGYLSQDNFLNMAVEISTHLNPESFLFQIQKIEHELGRIRNVRWGPRIIDIDILYWGEKIFKTDHLQIPHSEIENRRFVLIPLNEIAPNFESPPRFQKISVLLENVQDNSRVQLFLPKANLELNH
ncbi:MAG: 2-amino-4-hydroxy-6-hydroxymethyldihydropteridine diphosphokinase [bacterium]